MIKSKQLEDTLRSESNPFDIVYADKTVGDLNGAVRFTALNNTGSTIGAYKVVYINGVSGNTPTIDLADANDASAMPAFGITVSEVTTGNQVDVITFGNLKGVDTSLLTVGTVLYVSATAGEYTSTAPTGSTSKLQNIGMVVKSHTNGIIKVGGAGRSAATPNLDQGKFFIGNASAQSSQSGYQLPATLTNTGVLVANSDSTAVLSTDVLSIDTVNSTVDVDDNVKLRLGTGNDFELFHDGTNSIIKDNAASGGSTIKYLAGTQTFQNKDANKTMAVFNASGSIDLHHNGVKKFETTSSGIKTTGTLNLNDAYSLPTSDGDANQVLATDGSGQLSFVDQSGGGSSTITTNRTTSSVVNATVNQRYVLDTTASIVTINLPTTPSAGDFVLILPRYYNTSVTISSSDENVASAGYLAESSSTEVIFNSNEEVAIIYSGTEWIVESKNSELFTTSSTNLSVSSTYFSQYKTIFLTSTSNIAITLPTLSTLVDDVHLDFVITSENFRNTTLTINAASGESNLIPLGEVGTGSAGSSSITIPAPRAFTVYVVNTKYYIKLSNQERDGAINHLAVIPYVNSSYSGTAISLDKNKRYNVSSTTPVEFNLPDLSTLDNYGDFIEITQNRSSATPNYVTLNLSATDAAGSVVFSGLGFVRSAQTSINSIKVPLTNGLLRVTKVSNSSWNVQLLQSGYGSPIILNTAGTYSYDLDLGMIYIVDTDTIGGNVTLNLPYPYDEMISTQTCVKVLTDTYDVVIDPNSSSTIDELASITLTASSSALKVLNITPYAQGKYLVLSNY